jgi:rhodanese-related sulfurtransferase
MGFLFNRSKTDTSFENIDALSYNAQFVKGKQTHTLVDVRTAGEFQNGHLPGAVNIPLDQIGKRHTELDQNKPVIVVCASGNRSRTASKKLANAGFDEVYNLQGGTMAWMRAGLPIKR